MSALYDAVSLTFREGTRASILEKIKEWVDDTCSETFFWLYGPAGIGKSTIARAVAYGLAEKGQLGASYFFNENLGWKRSNLFFPTIASKLMYSIPGFAECLKASLTKYGNPKTESAEIDTKAPEEQFKRLIQAPLSKIARNSPEILTRIILIDALDEIKDDGIVRMICDQLFKLCKVDNVRLLVFLTSRQSPPIVTRLGEISHRPLSLLDFPNETRADISAYMCASFAAIKSDYKITENPWPRSEDLDRLLTLATTPSPLFIYAATLCRFVGVGTDNPSDQLKYWLEQADSNASQLDQTYKPIITRLLCVYQEGQEPQPIAKRAKSKLLQVLGSIVLLVTPLSAMTLAGLLNMPLDDINYSLQRLHAVLNIPKDPVAPLEILHKSFSDFLLGQEGMGTDAFRVDASETHAMLASKCIERMKKKDIGLQKDICKLRNNGMPRAEIDESIIQKFILPDLKYACLNWIYHLKSCSQKITEEDKVRHHITDEDVYDFLRVHYLHWLEVLGLVGAMAEGHILVGSLQLLIAVSFKVILVLAMTKY